MGVVSRSLIVMYNLARKILQHRLYYTAINNVMYVVKTYNYTTAIKSIIQIITIK